MLQYIVTTVYVKGSKITVVSNIVWPQWIEWCYYLRSFQNTKYQNAPRPYAICTFKLKGTSVKGSEKSYCDTDERNSHRTLYMDIQLRVEHSNLVDYSFSCIILLHIHVLIQNTKTTFGCFERIVYILIISINRGSCLSRNVGLIIQIWCGLLLLNCYNYQAFVHIDQWNGV